VEVREAPPVKQVAASGSSAENARLTQLESEVATLHKEIADLKASSPSFESNLSRTSSLGGKPGDI